MQGPSHAPQELHRLAGEEGLRFAAPDHREAAGLVQVGGDLGQELVVAEADGYGDLQFIFHLANQFRETFCRALAMQGRGAGEVQVGLIDRQRLHQGREREHHGAKLLTDLPVAFHVRAHHDGVRAGLQGLEHGHGRVHAVGAGQVAAGRHHAAVGTADDQRLVAPLRVVTLFDRGIEGIAVEVGDGQFMQLRMAYQAHRPACRTRAGVLGPQHLAAVSTQAVHALRIMCARQRVKARSGPAP